MMNNHDGKYHSQLTMAADAAMVGRSQIAAQSRKVWPWAIPSCFGAAQNGREPTDPLNFLRLLLLPPSRRHQLLKLIAISNSF